MEAEKSHTLLSASWRPGKAAVWFQSKAKGLRTTGANGVSSSQNPQARKPGAPNVPEQKMSVSAQPTAHFSLPSAS